MDGSKSSKSETRSNPGFNHDLNPGVIAAMGGVEDGANSFSFFIEPDYSNTTHQHITDVAAASLTATDGTAKAISISALEAIFSHERLTDTEKYERVKRTVYYLKRGDSLTSRPDPPPAAKLNKSRSTQIKLPTPNLTLLDQEPPLQYFCLDHEKKCICNKCKQRWDRLLGKAKTSIEKHYKADVQECKAEIQAQEQRNRAVIEANKALREENEALKQQLEHQAGVHRVETAIKVEEIESASDGEASGTIAGASLPDKNTAAAVSEYDTLAPKEMQPSQVNGSQAAPKTKGLNGLFGLPDIIPNSANAMKAASVHGMPAHKMGTHATSSSSAGDNDQEWNVDEDLYSSKPAKKAAKPVLKPNGHFGIKRNDGTSAVTPSQFAETFGTVGFGYTGLSNILPEFRRGPVAGVKRNNPFVAEGTAEKKPKTEDGAS